MLSTRSGMPSSSTVIAKRQAAIRAKGAAGSGGASALVVGACSAGPGGSGSGSGLRRLVGALALTLVLGGLTSGSADAVNVFTLDTSPDSFAGEAVDSSGTGYFAWEHKVAGSGDVTEFCKVPSGGTCPSPIVLPTPPLDPAPYDSTQVTAAFPVLGGGSTVYVVGPRYVAADVVVWTSTDGGVTFGPAVQVTQSGAYLGSPTNVLLGGAGFYVSSSNPGLYFTSVQAGPSAAASADLTPAGGLTNISGSTLGLAGGGAAGNPVEAFSMLNGGQPQTIGFRSFSGSGDPGNAANWSASSPVSEGILPSLAGGPDGLFLASEDYAGGKYSRVQVRKYAPGSGFGAPVTLQSDTSFDSAGRIFQTPTSGRLLVAWPGTRLSDGGEGIRLYQSTDSGVSFSGMGEVAEGTPFYSIGPDSIQLAAADNGQGFVSFLDYGSGNQLLRVADFRPILQLSTGPVSVRQFTIAAQVTVSPGGKLIVTSTITNGQALAAAASGRGCRTGQVLVRRNGRKQCVSSSFGSKTLSLRTAGTYTVRLSANAAAKNALNHGKTLHVKETLTFHPTGGGKAAVRTLRATVVGRRHS